MRGKDEQQLDVFSYISPEQRVPQEHPLRSLRVMTDAALRELQPRFNKLHAKTGRPSIAPEKLLRALLLQALYSVRSERLLVEQLDYNLLFRWFVGLNMDDAFWGCDRVHQEPRAPARWGHCRSLLPSRASAGTGAESALGRALYRGWNATGSVGECEELSTQRGARFGAQSHPQTGSIRSLLSRGRARHHHVLVEQVGKLHAPPAEPCRARVGQVVRDVIEIQLLRVHAACGSIQGAEHKAPLRGDPRYFFGCNTIEFRVKHGERPLHHLRVALHRDQFHGICYRVYVRTLE